MSMMKQNFQQEIIAGGMKYRFALSRIFQGYYIIGMIPDSILDLLNIKKKDRKSCQKCLAVRLSLWGNYFPAMYDIPFCYPAPERFYDDKRTA